MTTQEALDAVAELTAVLIADEAPAAHGDAAAAAEEGEADACPICLEPVDSNAHTTDCCHATFCGACVRRFVEFAIREGSTELQCPTYGCGQSVDPESVTNVDPFILTRWRRLRSQRAIDADPNLRWCTDPQCGGVADMTAAGRGRCGTCGTAVCGSCGSEAHFLTPCSWRDASLLNSWTRSADARRCPSCSAMVEKAGGCQHMTCRAPGCHAQWCWHCGLDWSRHPQYQGLGLCLFFRTMRSRAWGPNTPTRLLTKAVGMPLACGLGVAGVGVAGAAAVVGAVVFVAGFVPYAAGRGSYEWWKRRQLPGPRGAGGQVLSVDERLARGIASTLTGPAAQDVLDTVAESLPGRWFSDQRDSYLAYTSVRGKSTMVLLTLQEGAPPSYGYRASIECPNRDVAHSATDIVGLVEAAMA